MSLGNVTKQHIKRDKELMTFKVLTNGKYDIKVKMGAFGVKTRNSDSQNIITKIRHLTSEFYGSSISNMNILFTNNLSNHRQ